MKYSFQVAALFGIALSLTPTGTAQAFDSTYRGTSTIPVQFATPLYGDLIDLDVPPHASLGLSFPGSERQYYSAIADGGMGVARIPVQWRLREPAPGQYEWAGLDQSIRALQWLGIDPFLTFESNADWATRPATHGITNGTPVDYQEWAEFVRRTVERYDGDGVDDMPGLLYSVRWYQAANEWDTPGNAYGGWLGTVQELVDFVNTTHDAVKAADPLATFVLGGLVSANLDALALNLNLADYEIRIKKCATCETISRTADDFQRPQVDAFIADRIVPVLGARYDYLDVHLYGPQDRDPVRIAALRQFDSRPMLSSECGGPSLSYQDYVPEHHFMAVFERNLIDLSEGLEFCLWFRLGGGGTTYGNSQTALFDDLLDPKPGYFAYKLVAFALKDAVFVERGIGNSFIIYRGGRRPLVVVWAAEGQFGQTIVLPDYITGHVLTVTDPVLGKYQVEPLSPSRQVTLSEWPIIAGEL